LHIAGKPAAHDRNGTWDFMQACPDGVVVTQSDDLAWQLRRRFSRCDVFTNVQDAEYMYSLGDVMVLPRKYGGNCLPLNEALATGMPVIMTDIEPNNNLLPKEWLVPATKVDSFTPRGNVDIYQVNHQLLAEKLEWFRLQNTAEHSDKAYEIAQSISWQTLLPKYQELLESL
jgi:glycosyltransferase involved in cell wall biosynthesis